MKLIAIAMLALTGCTVANSPRMKFAGQSTSQRSVPELAGCIALQLAELKNVNTVVTELPMGKRLTTTVSVSGVRFVQQVVDIEDKGEARQVTMQKLLADVPAGSQLPAPTTACL